MTVGIVVGVLAFISVVVGAISYLLCKKIKDTNKSKVLDPIFVVSKPTDILGDVHQDMSKPLSNYFIASSHNTYLATYQLSGKSSHEAYEQALKMGARCIEIDCRNGKNGAPVVTHGWFTTRIPLEEVVETIKKHAFVTSKYPVILSIEDQTTGEQKGQVCIILNQILDKALYCPQEDHQKTYLSPHNLREKFIPIYSKKYNVPCHKTPLPQVDLKKDYNDHINIDYPSAMINVSERSRKISTDKCINWAQKQMVRVYPHGLRIFSDNFCPQSLWKEGVQMVALNYQTDDKYMQLNQQMFAQNGKCGYILKPKELRPAQPIV